MAQKKFTSNFKDKFYNFCNYLNKNYHFSNGNLRKNRSDFFWNVFKSIRNTRITIKEADIKSNVNCKSSNDNYRHQNSLFNKSSGNRHNQAINYLPVFEQYNLFGKTCYFSGHPECKCEIVREDNTKFCIFIQRKNP